MGFASFGQDLAFASSLKVAWVLHPLDWVRLLGSSLDYWDADDIALEMSDHPNIWTDGSREDFSSVGGFEVAGAGVYLAACGSWPLMSAVWGVAEEFGDARLERCRVLSAVFLG